jgi:hypothetical protein
MPDYNSPIPLLDATIGDSSYSGPSLGENVNTSIDAGGTDTFRATVDLHPDWDALVLFLDPTLNDLWYNPYTGPPLLDLPWQIPVPPVPAMGFGHGPFGHGPFGG